jgi:hypothetical protein
MKKILTLILLSFTLFCCEQKNNDTNTGLTGEAEKTDLFTETAAPVALIHKVHMDNNLTNGRSDTIEDYKLYKIQTPNGGKMYFTYTGFADTVLLRPLPENYFYKITYDYGSSDGGGYPEKSLYAEYPMVTEVEMLKIKSKH